MVECSAHSLTQGQSCSHTRSSREPCTACVTSGEGKWRGAPPHTPPLITNSFVSYDTTKVGVSLPAQAWERGWLSGHPDI